MPTTTAARLCLSALVLAATLCFGNVAHAEPSEAQPRAVAAFGAEADPGVKAWQVVSAIVYLAVLAGVGFALVRYARRGFAWRTSKPEASLIRTLGTARLSPTVTVTLIDVEGRRVLVASTASGTSMIEISKNA